MLLRPALRKTGEDRMVYATPVGFRIVFVGIALVIILSIATVSGGAFLARLNALSLILIGICLFAALYLERWTFDRKANHFERQVGILFLFRRTRRPLDALRKVVLHGFGAAPQQGTRPQLWASRRTVVLSMVDKDDHAYLLDMGRGGSVHQIRDTAERLAAFCAIPLEDDTEGRTADPPTPTP